MKYFLFFLLFSFFSYASGSSCPDIFKSSLNPSDRRIVFDGFAKLSDQSEIYVKIEKAPGKKQPRQWLFLIHGLLDSHRGWEDFTKLFIQKNYGVIRMDLWGHGNTLDREKAQTPGYKVPYQINYETNVEKLHLLIDWLKKEQGISHPLLIGHSLGGGLAFALASDPLVQKKINKLVFGLAPYIKRLDYQGLPYTGLALDFLPIYERIVWYRKEDFRDFFISRLQKIKIPEKDYDEDFIKLHVQAGMAVIRGVKHLNSIKNLESIPENIRIVQVIAGKDHLMPVKFQEGLLRKAHSNASAYLFKEAGHMLIEEKKYIKRLISVIDNEITNLK